MATTRPVSITALWTASERARESEYKDSVLNGKMMFRICHDFVFELLIQINSLRYNLSFI